MCRIAWMLIVLACAQACSVTGDASGTLLPGELDRGVTLETLVPLFVTDYDTLIPPRFNGAPRAVEDYLRDPERHPRLKGYLPEGSILSVVKVERHKRQVGGASLVPVAEPQDGPWRGRRFDITGVETGEWKRDG